MTKAELNELIADCPVLYHMAEQGSWPSIQEHGLLSTSALLDKYSVSEPLRSQLEKQHRPESVTITAYGLPDAIIRDQKPMSDKGLKRCLPPHISPSQWYELLNGKVFFWLTEERVNRLLKGKEYRDRQHDILQVDTRSLIEAHREHICLCPMNSGCTKPFPHPRDEKTFAPIADYPYNHWRAKRRRGERVVELAVDYSVPDISKHSKKVFTMQGTKESAKVIEVL